LLAAQMVCDAWDCTDMASGFSYTYPVFIYPFSSPVMSYSRKRHNVVDGTFTAGNATVNTVNTPPTSFTVVDVAHCLHHR